MSEYRERIGAPLSSTDLKQLQAKLARARADLSRLESEYTRATANAYWHVYHHTDRYRGKHAQQVTGPGTSDGSRGT